MPAFFIQMSFTHTVAVFLLNLIKKTGYDDHDEEYSQDDDSEGFVDETDDFDEEYGEPSTRKTPPRRRSSSSTSCWPRFCCCCGRSSYDGFALRMLVCIGAALCLLTVGIAFGVRTVQHRAIQKPSYEDLVWNELPLAVQTGTCVTV